MKIKKGALALAIFLLLTGSMPAQENMTFPKSMLFHASPRGKTIKTPGSLRVGREGILFISSKGITHYEADYSSINKIFYERTKKPRYAAGLLLAWPLLFTKEKQHYLTFQSEGSHALIKMHKSQFQIAITTLESTSGQAVERIIE